MISEAAEFDQFITDHRWAVLTHLRGDGSPVSSVVAYAREADEIVVSTPGKTFKRRALDRDPRVNLCILSNQEPFNFVALEGTATIETTHLEAPRRRCSSRSHRLGIDCLRISRPGWNKATG